MQKLLQNTSVPDIKSMDYLPLTKDSIEILKEQLEPSMKDKFLKVCLDALDTDPSTLDSVKDELGCADTVSHLIKKLLPDFPIIVSTKDLDMKLFMDKRFRRETEPAKGRIIISPRNNTQYGHTGVWITEERIASNNSFGINKGKFNGNYTYAEWIKEFKEKRGLRIYIYSLV